VRNVAIPVSALDALVPDLPPVFSWILIDGHDSPAPGSAFGVDFWHPARSERVTRPVSNATDVLGCDQWGAQE
jgi:hypothetical protein